MKSLEHFSVQPIAVGRTDCVQIDVLGPVQAAEVILAEWQCMAIPMTSAPLPGHLVATFAWPV